MTSFTTYPQTRPQNVHAEGLTAQTLIWWSKFRAHYFERESLSKGSSEYTHFDWEVCLSIVYVCYLRLLSVYVCTKQ